MKQAIPTVFTEAHHCLCMWHIMKKFNQKLAKCISKMDDFKRKINALIWSIDIDPATFEVGWKDVMKEYKLESNEWLCELYNIRESWIPAYYADDPMAGLLRTTSISESENSFFDKFNRRSDTLTEFYLRYESAMEKQRHTNARLNYEGTKSMPRMDTPLLLERDAAELYTRTMFYEVQSEIISSYYDMSINSISEEDGVKIFSIKDKKRHGKIFEVKHSYLNNDVQCTCRLFEKMGIVCRHGFFALNQADVTKIPRHLIVNRWTKGSEMRHSLQFKEISEQCNAIEVTNRLDGERLDYLEGKLKELKHS
ncbi:protein FAR1-RELATED SEQUENCE 5-like, partial [Asparagus officinalis]|uniref:protein FAR1-RELATED SEQUENCE 5-like n=1 Tax=Asparagus officinalis TaxID=4686 RepID=UPI00098E4132